MENNFNEGIHFLKFGADWCSPCRAMEPVLNKFKNEHINRVNIHSFNVDEETELTAKFGIRAIPTIIVIKNGENIDRISGAQTDQTLLKKLEDAESH
jgi:thioredoxin 1